MSTSRIACLHIRRFQIAVHQNHEPELKGQPFVILTGTSNSSCARVFMCSPEATDVFPAMKLSEARAACANLIWRQYNPALYLNAHNTLLHALIACSHKVSTQKIGIFLLDASGLQYLRGEAILCQHVLKTSSQCGFTDGYIGIADSAFAAIVATRFKHKQQHIVPAGTDAPFLAPLSIRHLPLHQDIQDSLLELGIKSMGQLTRLPITSITERFGQEGALAHALAQGKDQRQPQTLPPQKKFCCSAELGAPVDSLTETIFLLKPMLNQLMTELRQEGLSADELLLSFYNDDDKLDEHPIRLIHPSTNPKFLLELVQLSLESQPLKREFTSLELSISRFSKAAYEQLHISAPATSQPPRVKTLGGHRLLGAVASLDAVTQSPATSQPNEIVSDSLLLLVQRLTTRCEANALIHPVSNDQYLPDDAGIWIPVLQHSPASPILPVATNYIKSYSGYTHIPNGLVLRKNQFPLPVLVRLHDSSPTAIAYHKQWHQIKLATTPECLSGLWWDHPTNKSYYLALVEPKHRYSTSTHSSSSDWLILLVNNHQNHHWFIEGFFD
ncbi:MAG: DNA polymerase Y family protein [Candidatus Melainabacteria bacterium]|nr:DNA polymerase Y family protein [Candidatus Melainabacteria bacterium]